SSPPAISGLGSSAGFDMELQDHAGAGHDALMAARDQLIELAGSLFRARLQREAATYQHEKQGYKEDSQNGC
ncbi:hypothetical protein KU617_23775, partial [Salmonella enterica subsp. enterica serovar Montevideo]|nr:hypothetical protein [Salmonella enterica subsp. enterica serovar Montevideo]